jgi:hypothetical protein
MWFSTFYLVLVAGAVVAQDDIKSNLRMSLGKPSCAVPLPGNLLGFSIEPDRFPDWAGNVSSKNEYTYTLMSDLKEKTGVTPSIR